MKYNISGIAAGKTDSSAAYNGRFGASWGVTPQKVQCEHDRLCPHERYRTPPLRQVAGRYVQADGGVADNTKKNCGI